MTFLRPIGLVLALVALLGTTAAGACDPAGVDAAALRSTYTAVDAACPCYGFSRGEYRACATTAVVNEITGLRLAASCRRDALRYARKSRCGRPGAAVCCRLSSSGRERHRVVSDSSRCLPPSGGSACVSTYQSVVTGCDATGCVAPAVCGDGILEFPETCDPPDLVSCDFSCQLITCPAPGLCGNGVVDPGETCEPPGTATCNRTCQPATCPAALPGETMLACLDQSAQRVGVASNGSGYLAAWDGRLLGSGSDILARRLDTDGVAADPGPVVVSDGAPCGDQHFQPTVASDGTDYAVSWRVNGASGFTEEIFVREVAGGGIPVATPLQLDSQFPFGMCRADLLPPLTTAAVASHRYAVAWRNVVNCFPGGELFESPLGTLITLPAGAPSVGIGFPSPSLPPPGVYAGGPTFVASLGPDLLAVAPVAFIDSSGPPTPPVTSVAAAWIDESSGATTAFSLGSAAWSAGFGPTVAAGDTSFLVAWGNRTGPDATSLTEIRGRRVTRLGGPLDSDGGFLIATVAAGDVVAAGPAIAFDGTVWLVAWIEQTGTTFDLRTMAVRADGSIVTPIPVPQASGVANVVPAVASAGAGKVVVVFERVYAGGVAGVHSLVVTPGS